MNASYVFVIALNNNKKKKTVTASSLIWHIFIPDTFFIEALLLCWQNFMWHHQTLSALLLVGVTMYSYGDTDCIDGVYAHFVTKGVCVTGDGTRLRLSVSHSILPSHMATLKHLNFTTWSKIPSHRREPHTDHFTPGCWLPPIKVDQLGLRTNFNWECAWLTGHDEDSGKFWPHLFTKSS